MATFAAITIQAGVQKQIHTGNVLGVGSGVTSDTGALSITAAGTSIDTAIGAQALHSLTFAAGVGQLAWEKTLTTVRWTQTALTAAGTGATTQIFGQNAPVAVGNGGAIFVTGGTGTAAGGLLNFAGGAGGTGAGGSVSLTGGAGTVGGNASVTSGVGSATAGGVSITASDGGTVGGTVAIRSGQGNNTLNTGLIEAYIHPPASSVIKVADWRWGDATPIGGTEVQTQRMDDAMLLWAGGDVGGTGFAAAIAIEISGGTTRPFAFFGHSTSSATNNGGQVVIFGGDTTGAAPFHAGGVVVGAAAIQVVFDEVTYTNDTVTDLRGESTVWFPDTRNFWGTYPISNSDRHFTSADPRDGKLKTMSPNNYCFTWSCNLTAPASIVTGGV